MERARLATCGLLLTTLPMAAAVTTAQNPDTAKQPIKLGCDRSAIQWSIPGQFKQARARAKRQKRLLIIKGISFGVDDAGAKCATKGKW